MAREIESLSMILGLFNALNILSKQLKNNFNRENSQRLFANVRLAAGKLVELDNNEWTEALQELKVCAKNIQEKANEAEKLLTQLLSDMKGDINECYKIIERWINQTAKAIDDNELKCLIKLIGKQQEPFAKFLEAFKEFHLQMVDMNDKANKMLDDMEKQLIIMKESDDKIVKDIKKNPQFKEYEDDYKRRRNAYIAVSSIVAFISGVAVGIGCAALTFVAPPLFPLMMIIGCGVAGGCAGGLGFGIPTYFALDYFTQNSENFKKFKSDFKSRINSLLSEVNELEKVINDFKIQINEFDTLIDYSKGEDANNKVILESIQCVMNEVAREIDDREEGRQKDEAIRQLKESLKKEEAALQQQNEELRKKDEAIQQQKEEFRKKEEALRQQIEELRKKE